MEVSQGNSLCISFILFLSYTKSEKKRAEQIPPGEAGTGGMEEDV
jgi:hypothetical protein